VTGPRFLKWSGHVITVGYAKTNYPNHRNHDAAQPNPRAPRGEPFSIELANGRIIQVYDPFSVATIRPDGPDNDALILVLHPDRFDLIMANQVTGLSAGIHAKETEARQARIAERRKGYGE